MEDISYQIKLPVFEGPLDLLIHLININEIDICNIPIAQITSEYLEYINLMRELNLEIASEFLLMAATLIYIKSKMLLPNPPKEDVLEDELDPRTELVDLLLEHQRFKKTAQLLKKREEEQRLVYAHSPQEWGNKDQSERLMEVSLFDLITALKRVLQQKEKKKSITLRQKDFSLKEKIEEIMGILAERKRFVFSSFFFEMRSKREIILYFLALLEIVRIGAVKIYQKKPLGEIVILRLENSLLQP